MAIKSKAKFTPGDAVLLYGCQFSDATGEYAGSYSIFGKVVDTEFPEDDEPWVTVRNEITGCEITELQSFIYRLGD